MPLVSCQRYLLGATIVLLASSLLLWPRPARATNGYWAHGYGPKSKAMAGAGAALPLDAMDAAQNPAKMVWLGNRMDLGLAAFMPDRSFTANDDGGNGYPAISPDTYDSGNGIFFIPHLARNRMLDATSSLGISIGANGGMNTEYDAAVFSAFNNPGNTATSPTGIDFKQLFIGLTYARKIAANHSCGITPIAAAQSLKVTGLQPFQPFSSDPEHVTNNGYDYSYGGGLKIGWLSRITDSVSLGAAYQTKLWMSKFDDYRGLFAGQGNFDIPANFTAGLAWQMTPSLTLAADVQRILFEEVKSIGNSGGMVLRPGSIMLGMDDGIGFGWRNMTIGKFGLQWQCLTGLTLRAGYSTGNQPIAGEQALFNILAPAVVTEHYTLGLTRTFGNMELSLSLLYAPENTVSGTNPNTGPQTGSLAMSQYEVEIGLGFVF